VFLAEHSSSMTNRPKKRTGRRPTGKMTFPLRIDPSLKDMLEEIAKLRRIPISQVAEEILAAHTPKAFKKLEVPDESNSR
jgi:hypothetical protein